MLTLPTVVFVSYWWLMPESIRWLISKEKFDEARQQVVLLKKVLLTSL